MVDVLFSFVFGSCIGSFGAATVAAWLDGKQFWRKRSSCPVCKHVLGVTELIPVFSYFLLHGRCAHCGERISPFYSVVELLCGLGAALFIAVHGLSILSFIKICLAALLITAAACDAKSGLLPDFLTLGGMAIFVPLFVCFGSLKAWDAVMGVVLGAGLLLVLRQLFLLFRHKDVLGLGDAKLLALLGGVCGWQALPAILLLSSLCGIAASGLLFLAKKGPERIWEMSIPFGPFLCGAAIAIMLFPNIVFTLIDGMHFF